MDPDDIVLDLLAGKNPNRARNMMLAWEERRSASWANAARDAEARAAFEGHLPHIRGQLRYHGGETALREAARSAGAGALPLHTKPPGGIFTVARVGKFALVSVMIRERHLMPRRTVTRKLLSQPNDGIDPQSSLFSDEKPKTVTELAYFGCLVAVAAKRDPTVPAELALAIPTRSLDQWISWTPLHRLHAALQERASGAADDESSGDLPDIAFPTFRVPSEREDTGDD
jgi:hypothetical protein